MRRDDRTEVWPSYSGGGLAGFPATVLGHFARLQDADAPADALPALAVAHHVALDQDVRLVACVMIDAFGYLQVREQLQAGNLPNLQRLLDRDAQMASLTSVFPPSTAPANVSFSTGLAPTHHGVAGFTIWLPGREVVANMITGGPAGTWESFPDAAGIARGTTLFERLTTMGVESYVINLAAYARSFLSGLLYRSATYVPYVTPSTVAVRLDGLLRDLLGRRMPGWLTTSSSVGSPPARSTGRWPPSCWRIMARYRSTARGRMC